MTTYDGQMLQLRLSGRPWELRELQLIVDAIANSCGRELEYQSSSRSARKRPSAIPRSNHRDIITILAEQRLKGITGEIE